MYLKFLNFLWVGFASTQKKFKNLRKSQKNMMETQLRKDEKDYNFNNFKSWKLKFLFSSWPTDCGETSLKLYGVTRYLSLIKKFKAKIYKRRRKNEKNYYSRLGDMVNVRRFILRSTNAMSHQWVHLRVSSALMHLF